MKFKNKDDISKIKMDGMSVKCFCPIGQSLCTYNVTIVMEPDTEIPDYIEVCDMVNDLNSRELTIESAVARICNSVFEYVLPNRLEVTIRCNDAKHMPAEVTKVMEK